MGPMHTCKVAHQPTACICPFLHIPVPGSLPRALHLCSYPTTKQTLHHHLSLSFLLLTPRGFFLSSDWTHGVNYSMAFCQNRFPGHLLLSYKLFSKQSYFDPPGTERSKWPGSRCSGHDKMVLSGASVPVVAVISRRIPLPSALSAWGDCAVCYSRGICHITF